MIEDFKKYIDLLKQGLDECDLDAIALLAESLFIAWKNKKYIYIIGNGGSAGNAIHIANDFTYGAGIKNGIGLKVEALTANSSIITCLANDLSYEKIFSEQIRTKAESGDVLIALSGSGNSPNILEGIKLANHLGLQTFAILGFSGGEAKKIAKKSIHFKVNDMQIAEDFQLVVGHMCMKWLSKQILEKSTDER